ncbi:Cruciform DNA binding protein [Recurvomyces mirabilis]|uniref:Cruciform DNA binding protein n=1 Tax=Recurvomyces mirabilis TaxID=574656 RepID=A0AAE0WWA4_9PEZI|nr:Cruciform DNA binding protein [Recurvomyces mirabilis]KAK5161387.1 Cruciform DNA binding protein [Recurvomyces mirabilis]
MRGKWVLTSTVVTGTFDNWGKTIKLDKSGTAHEKTVPLKSHEKILYKFVADGVWNYDHTAKSEADHEGNLNNVLYSEDLQKSHSSNTTAAAAISSVAPGASTAAMAGQQPLEHTSSRDLPGAFPETPAFEKAEPQHEASFLPNVSSSAEKSMSVNPLPATGGMGNPISLQPGEKIPEQTSLTGNTLTSNVKLDKESYERSDTGAPVLPAALSPTSEKEAFGEKSIFGLGPQTSNMIPESSMGMGKDAPAAIDPTPMSSSVGPQSTTNQLAGAQPLEPRGEAPAVVAESQDRANVDPEASSNPAAVQEKDQVENELLSKVPEAPATASNGMFGSSERGVLGAAAAGVTAAGGAAVAGAAYLNNQKNKAVENNSVGGGLTGSAPLAHSTSSTTPAVVSESQHEAHASPEASANPEAVQEKSAVENELLSRVPTEPATSSSGALGSSERGIAGMAAGGVAAATGAAAAGAAYVTGKENHNPNTSTIGSTTGAQSLASESTSTPLAVTESQQKAHVGPEASANPEAVQEKSAVENELLTKVPTASATSSSGAFGSSERGVAGMAAGGLAAAGGVAAAGAAYVTGQDKNPDTSAVGSTSAPLTVTESQQKAHFSPEASANPAAVQEKDQVENELLSKVPTAPATSSNGAFGSSEKGVVGMAAGGGAAAGAATAGVAYLANDKLKDATGRDAVGALPQSVQQSIASMNNKGSSTSAQQPQIVKDSLSSMDNKGSTGASALPVSESTIPQQTHVGEGVTIPAGGEARGVASSVPEEVAASQKEAHVGPEAAANTEAVREKSAMENELLKKVPEHNETGAPAPSSSAALSSTAPAAASTFTSAVPAPSSTGAPQLGDPTSGVAALSLDSTSKSATGLNAPASEPAMPPTQKAAQTLATPPAAPVSADRSRDVSPMSKPVGGSASRATAPQVTDGVAATSTVPATSTAGKPVGTPRPAASGSSATPEKKRHSFMGKSKGTPDSTKSTGAASEASEGGGKKKGFLKRLADKLK